MKKILILLAALLMSITPVVMAENPSPNKELLEEIDIMEAVLTRLISRNDSGITYQGSDAKGFYLSDYGVIFNVSYPNFTGVFVAVASEDSAESVYSKNSQIITGGMKREEAEKAKGNLVSELKKSLTTFFTKYASTLSGLKPDEKITVILDLNGDVPVYRNPQSKDNYPHQLTATVAMNDITGFQGDTISAKDLEKRVIFNEINTIDDEVSIFSNVIQTSLKHLKGNASPFPRNVRSAYIQGHGIIFMTDIDQGIKAFRLINKNLEQVTRNLADTHKEAVTLVNSQIIVGAKSADADLKNEPETKEDDFKEYEDKLINVISKYGHTLSKIRPDEWVEIAFNLDSMGMDGKFSKGLIKVKKMDIDDLNKGKTDFTGFRKKVSVLHY